MLARRLTTILPAMTLAEAIDTDVEPPHPRPDGRPPNIRNHLSFLCTDLMRGAQDRTSPRQRSVCGLLVGLSARGSTFNPVIDFSSRLPRHRPHPTPPLRDGSRIGDETVRWHRSCPCHPSETSLTPHVHSTLIAPTGHDAAASVAAGAEENTDDDGDDIPDLAPSCPYAPAGAPPFPPEAAKPHAPPSLLKDEALTMPSSTSAMIACEHRRRAAESGDTRRAALPNGDQRS